MKYIVEVFSAGGPACQETIDLVNSIACPSCEMTVHSMNDDAVAQRVALVKQFN